MPYPIKKVGSGFKVVSKNHPAGFSKKPQTKSQARAQQKALYANAAPAKETATKLKGMIK